ncbi:exodeoxyribonuclease V subunit beta [Bradyrhizobium sp. CCGUVB23]|uniref:UvrD-helicase domain-containing protein n=1 Tax=Bradyrhizobium sp. CCGUVB23 TaxID=2949630 RepID=UPI0020B38805|nr:UvrD-helicase domain-containing protein [Bradyrhizobium sp. CCGUVB23]MCP3468192.1 UvrD-helicase domain-containing protein [Bradyrhizobium sp. CCGUVB23]
MTLADDSARLRILTDLGVTLLVEAAAGTGKTALMAGRLTMLLAGGAEPGTIAAITFTELAASALSARVHRYVEELLADRVPQPLRLAIPHGLDADQRRVLSAAAAKLDELTTATIHAFCQTIITSYAVEADIDPGARILDAVQASAAFDSVFEQWLKRRLNAPERPGDPIVTLSRDDPRRVVDTLQALARFRLRYRGARTLSADFGGRPDIDLADAVADFRRWISSQPPEPKTLELVGELETLANFYAGSFDPPPDFETLWRLAHPPQLGCMRRRSFDLLTPRRKSAWERVAGKERGARVNEEATACFERVDRCYRTLLGRIATALVAQLSAELDEVLNDYAAFKRAAAVLDFDDLLEKARALVRQHDAVRRALGERYRYIFVDEFQDTDPIQTEILFQIATEDRAERWQDSLLRSGALFMVGDPKQAIYRFRGADIGSYAQARATIERQFPDNIVQVTANFRSRPEILAYINRCFARPLSGDGQPGYVPLAPTLDGPDHDLPCAARITVDVPPDSRPAQIRDAEAEAVADLCARLIGNLRVRDEGGTTVPLTAGGIALLAPTGAELWRYERALEQRGLPIASQAGKSLFRRQEVQDLLALARTLADAGDTLAFGALMRGPLVGLTEEELLDITAGLPSQSSAMPRFSLLTDLDHVVHPHARRALAILQDLRRRARATTPALLLAEAVERLSVRPFLAAREGHRSARAAANIEAFLERARPYGVRGLKKFVRDLAQEWRDGVPHNEGRVDSEGDAIEIITIHSAKGLEWPVVIPINTGTLLRSREPFVYRAADETLHWLIGDVVPPELLRALESEDDSLARERERLWYVACTRACELLIVPELPQAEQRSWARIVDLAQRDLPQLVLSRLSPVARTIVVEPMNGQTRELFEAERVIVDSAATPLRWLRPSDHDPDRAPVGEAIAIELGEAPETELPIGAGRVRGLVLHKLMEEILTGELVEDASDVAARARVLVTQLVIDTEDGAQLPDPDEIATTVLRTLALPEVVSLRPNLVSEWPIYAMLAGPPEASALAGRIDAIALQDGQPFAVLDWKSDVAPSEQDMREHAAQLGDYLRATGTARGAVVYMTGGIIRWVTASMPRSDP